MKNANLSCNGYIFLKVPNILQMKCETVCIFIIWHYENILKRALQGYIRKIIPVTLVQLLCLNVAILIIDGCLLSKHKRG